MPRKVPNEMTKWFNAMETNFDFHSETILGRQGTNSCHELLWKLFEVWSVQLFKLHQLLQIPKWNAPWYRHWKICWLLETLQYSFVIHFTWVFSINIFVCCGRKLCWQTDLNEKVHSRASKWKKWLNNPQWGLVWPHLHALLVPPILKACLYFGV